MNEPVTINIGNVSDGALIEAFDLKLKEVLAKREIPLVPWRTFREVMPVCSKFMLRLRGVKDAVPQIALFEVDARWRLDNIQAVADYLSAQLPDVVFIK